LFAGHGALVTGLDGPRGQGSNTADFGDTGTAYGLMAGYGATIGNAYFGAEIEGSLDGPDWIHRAERVFSVAKSDSFGIAARAGWLTPARDLLYGRIGISRTQLRTRYDLFDNHYDQTKWFTALNFGLGAEAGVGRSGFVRAEYVLASYNDINVPSGKGADNMSSSEGQFRFGGGIRFGGPATRKAVKPTIFGGPYLGVQVGYGALVSRNFGVREKSQAIDISRAGQGPLIGIFAGYGVTWNRLYAGLEADADMSRIDCDPKGRTYSARHQYSYGGGIRAGWLISKSAMLYGRIGPTRTRFIIPYETTNQSVRSERSKTGLRMGAGLEVGLGPRDRLRIDYTLTDYGAYDLPYGHNNSDRFQHDENVVRIGVAHRF
jgi:outer membrane immunogenic protein